MRSTQLDSARKRRENKGISLEREREKISLGKERGTERRERESYVSQKAISCPLLSSITRICHAVPSPLGTLVFSLLLSLFVLPSPFYLSLPLSELFRSRGTLFVYGSSRGHGWPSGRWFL
eukprot:scaffold235755_cov33-Tisochrysis_lutea.AAC.2